MIIFIVWASVVSLCLTSNLIVSPLVTPAVRACPLARVKEDTWEKQVMIIV